MTNAPRLRVERLPRMRRLISPFLPSEAASDRLDPTWLGAWLGIVVGLGELGILLITRWSSGRVTAATLSLNHHYFWMIPLGTLILLGGAGCGLGLVLRLVDRPWAWRAGTFLLAFLAAGGVALSIPRIHGLAALALALGAAWRLALWIEGHRRAARRLVAWSLPALGLVVATLVAVGAWKVSGAEARALASLPPPAPGAPNVLLIVLDTVRADALSPNRLERETTPNLAKLADRGVRFDRAWSTAPWTLPAHASLFTGLWAHEHEANAGRPLDSTHPTIAEALSARGYAAAGFMANTHNGNAWYGLGRGFARYEDLYENRAVTPGEVLRSSALGRVILGFGPGHRLLGALIGMPAPAYRKTAAMINRDLLAWLPTRGDRPFFAFLNYYDVHDPYEVPPGADRAYAQAGTGRERTVMEAARDDYDDCLRSLDDHLGRLFGDLEGRGLMDNTLVIVTSDHGEAFGEHGLQGHGISLYRPEMHVPLLVAHPSLVPSGRKVAEPVSTRDVADTILDLLRIDVDFPGESLARFWDGPAGTVAVQGEPILASVNRSAQISPLNENAPARRGPMFSIIRDGLVLIRRGDGHEELYRLADDPDEARDLASSPEMESDLGRLRDELSRVAGVRKARGRD